MENESKRSRNDMRGLEGQHKFHVQSQQSSGSGKHGRAVSVYRHEVNFRTTTGRPMARPRNSTADSIPHFRSGHQPHGYLTTGTGTGPAKSQTISKGGLPVNVFPNAVRQNNPPFRRSLNPYVWIRGNQNNPCRKKGPPGNPFMANSVGQTPRQPIASHSSGRYTFHALGDAPSTESYKMPRSSEETIRSTEARDSSSSVHSPDSSRNLQQHGEAKLEKADLPKSSEGRQDVLFDWDKQTDLLQQNLLASLPQFKQKRAKKLPLVHEELPGVPFSRREWVTNWVNVDEIAPRDLRSGDSSFAITTFEAEAILRSNAHRKSIITIVREEMLKRDSKAKIRVEPVAPYNPWYRYVCMRGRVDVIFQAMKSLHKLLKDCVFKTFSADEYRRALPPRPPLSKLGVRPMILMAHFDPGSNQIALNRGFCYDCITDQHVFCELDHRFVK